MSDLLSKYIIKKKTKDVIHSSVYAKAQNSDGIGAASTQSFSNRMSIEKNRSRIRGYNDSRVVSQARASSGIKSKTYDTPEKEGVVSRPPAVRNPGISKKI